MSVAHVRDGFTQTIADTCRCLKAPAGGTACASHPLRVPSAPSHTLRRTLYHALSQVCSIYPKIRVITSEIDRGINSDYVVVPGIGEFGNRYFSE